MTVTIVPPSRPSELPMRDTLDVRTLVAAVTRRWRFLALCAVVGAVVAAAMAIALPSRYRASASFQPESQMPSSLSGSLAGLASQLGAGALGGSQANPQFYADLVQSRALLLRLAGERFPSPKGVLPLYAIYGNEKADSNARSQRTADRLAKQMEVGLNFRTGVITFTVQGNSPAMAKALADSLLAALNDFNIRIRQSRAGNERKFTEARADEARASLSAAENAVADFNMRNRVTASPSLQVESERLRRNVDMASQVYVQLRLQAENAAAQEVRNTPALSVIDPPVEPIRRSWPNRRLMVVVGLVGGALLAVAWILAQLLRARRREDALA